METTSVRAVRAELMTCLRALNAGETMEEEDLRTAVRVRNLPKTVEDDHFDLALSDAINDGDVERVGGRLRRSS